MNTASSPRAAPGNGALVIQALLATAALVAVLPLLDLLRPAPPATLDTRPVRTAPPPARLPPPPPVNTVEPPPVAEPPLPRLASTRPAAPTPDAPRLNLPFVLPTFGPGDTALAFAVLPGWSEGHVFDILEADAPPRPLARFAPLYPPRARLRRQEGDVQVEFVVTPAGGVESPAIVFAQPPGLFEDAALQAVRRWRFEPGVKDGQAVAVRVRQKLTFKLEE